MSEPFIGEIRAFGFHFSPIDWAFCDGRLLPISQYTALYSVIGTTYGGDGQTTFALPNLQDRAAMDWGNGVGLTPRQIGQVTGSPSVSLLVTQLPGHMHVLSGADGNTATQTTPTPSQTAYLGQSNPGSAYTKNVTPNQAFSPKAIGNNGGSQPHNNMQPLLTLNFCIALNGIFPSRN